MCVRVWKEHYKDSARTEVAMSQTLFLIWELALPPHGGLGEAEEDRGSPELQLADHVEELAEGNSLLLWAAKHPAHGEFMA